MTEKKSVLAKSETKNVISPYVFSNNRITKTNCKLCNSELREEAEAMYEGQRRKNYTEIVGHLSTKGVLISVNAVKNHMLRHYEKEQRNLVLSEYSQDLEEWMKIHDNKLEALRARIAILDREMATIASIGEELDIIERRKNAETIKKIAETILSHEEKLKEYEEQLEPARVVLNHLKDIITDELKEVSDDRTKRVILNIMTRLKGNIGELLVGGK